MNRHKSEQIVVLFIPFPCCIPGSERWLAIYELNQKKQEAQQSALHDHRDATGSGSGANEIINWCLA